MPIEKKMATVYRGKCPTCGIKTEERPREDIAKKDLEEHMGDEHSSEGY